MNEVAASSQVPELWLSLLKSAGMLCIVIGIMFGVLYLIRRFSGASGSLRDQGSIRVLSSRYLAAKSRLMLVDVAGEKLLLGVTPQSINLIKKIDMEEDAPLEREESSAGFADMLGKALGGKKADRKAGDDNDI